MLCRSRVALFLSAVLLSACGRDRSPVEPAAPTRDPVLFVHGWNGSPANWNGMVQRFNADGWSERELHIWGYNSALSNVQIAEQLKLKVDEILAATNAKQVDIISHSMGGLSSRYYAKFLGGQQNVDAWVSIAGPNHGTRFAIYCSTAPCVEMRPESNFLLQLNAGDETPGAVRYATWWSACDEIIDPKQSVILSGAENTQTGCLGHTQLLHDATVYQQVRAWIAAEGL